MSLVNIAVGQSGGPTTVINASLYGVIKEACDNNDKIDKIYGMINGIEGFIEGKVIDIIGKVSEEEIELLKHTPAAYLGSCRYKLPESMEDSIYRIIFEKFDKLNIKYFIYIGGNDSMDTVHKLSVYAKMTNSPVRIIGVPKTIDNDLTKTDHSPGYGSAAKYVATTVRDIVMDANVYDTHSVTIIELMGRHAGWITAASVLARKYKGDNPVLIYLPEVAFDVKKFVQRVKLELNKKHNVIVCVSEGIRDSEGKFICEYSSEAGVDTFGHKMLTGCGKYLENYVKAEFGIKCRSIELNLPQRCSSLLASATDIDEAEKAGKAAVVAALDGETGKMITFERDDTNGYEINYGLADVNDICNKEKKFPAEWITADGTDISDEYIKYVRPLIQGTNIAEYSDGVPVHLKPAYYR